MKAAIALVGTILAGYVWLMLYAYAGGFDDLFLLAAVATAAIGAACQPPAGGVDVALMARLRASLPRLVVLSVALIVIGILTVLSSGGAGGLTGAVVFKITTVCAGAVALTGLIASFIQRV